MVASATFVTQLDPRIIQKIRRRRPRLVARYSWSQESRGRGKPLNHENAMTFLVSPYPLTDSLSQRLTALIQTRLTILQARLSLHSAAASVAATTPSTYPMGLEPRGSSSSASGSAPSPKLVTPVDERPSAADSLPLKKQGGGFWVHPSDREKSDRLPPIRTNVEHQSSHSRKSGSASPRSDDARRSANGLDMLLDAGMGRSSI